MNLHCVFRVDQWVYDGTTTVPAATPVTSVLLILTLQDARSKRSGGLAQRPRERSAARPSTRCGCDALLHNKPILSRNVMANGQESEFHLDTNCPTDHDCIACHIAAKSCETSGVHSQAEPPQSMRENKVNESTPNIAIRERCKRCKASSCRQGDMCPAGPSSSGRSEKDAWKATKVNLRLIAPSPRGFGLFGSSDKVQPNSNGLHPSSNGLIELASSLVAMASNQQRWPPNE